MNARLLAAAKEYLAAADHSVSAENNDDLAAMLRFGAADTEIRLAIKECEDQRQRPVPMPCSCIGPQRNDPLCPCLMVKMT